MYYNLLLSQIYVKVTVLLSCAAIFQLNSLTGKIPFLSLDWEFFLKLGKKEDILDWEWGIYLAPGDREKRPWEEILYKVNC